MFSIIIFAAILSVLIVVHESGHFFAAKRAGVRVEKFSLGFGPLLFQKKVGLTEYAVSLVPFGGYVKLAGDNLAEYTGKTDEYFSKSVGARFRIIFFGPLTNYILGFLCFWFIFFAGYPTLTTKIGGLLDGFGAQKSGLLAGDTITAIDGKEVKYWEDMQKIIQQKKESNLVKVDFLRGESKRSTQVNIREQKVNDQLGQAKSVGLLGVTPFDEIVIVKHGFLASFTIGAQKTWELTVLTYKGLWMILTRRISLRDSVSGPLGIFFITSKAAQLGFLAVLHLVAVLNISLALFNLLPFPVLDGGHLALLGIEKIRRKGLSLKAENVLNQVGFVFIISAAALITVNDIIKLWGDKIQKFWVR